MILGLLPLFSLLAVTLLLTNLHPEWQWRRSFLRATILTGVYAILTIEILSLIRLVHRLGLVLIWLLPIVISYVVLRKKLNSGQALILPKLRLSSSWFNDSIFLTIILITIITGIIAWVAPPNTYDSLTYHMSRVAHWAQEGGVRPYASGILRQNYMSPGAEMLILQTYVLAQSDQFANLIQWFAMVVSLIGVSQLAADLGAEKNGQLLAALFTATLPMGIAQASSTMTDYVTGAWVLLAVLEALFFIQAGRTKSSLLLSSSAAGLALLSKPTALVFLLPFAAWVIFKVFRILSWRKSVLYGLLAIFIILLLNLGYLTRNWLIFNNIFGGGSQVQVFTNEIYNLKVLVSNLLRNASLHAGTRWLWLNDQLYLLLAKVHWKLDLGLTDTRTSLEPFFTIWAYPSSETRATNTIQAVLILLVIFAALTKFKHINKITILYSAAVSLGFILFSLLFKYYALGSRYHMPFFVLAAPSVGVILERLLRPWIRIIISVILIIGAIPILFLLDIRPILSTDETGTIFSLRRLDQYFAEAHNLDEPYILMTTAIQEKRCNDIGLMLSGDTGEYPLWVLLDAPNEDLKIDWIISKKDVSGKYRIEGFTPCAVICERCEWAGDEFNGLPLYFQEYGFRLYLE
jgi:hypothetical protein